MTDTATKVPTGLSKEARQLWHDIMAEFSIETSTQRLVVLTACKALDRLRSAEKILKRDGITSRGRYGQVLSHPALSVERSARQALMAALGKIGFGGTI